MRTRLPLALLVALAFAACISDLGPALAPVAIVDALASPAAEERDAAIEAAANAGPRMVPVLATPLRDGPPEATRAALAALDRLVRRASAPGREEGRAATAGALRKLAADADLSAPVRGHVVRLLALVGDDTESIAFLAAQLGDADLAAPALFALESLGGPAAAKALLAARHARGALPPGAIVATLGAIRGAQVVPELVEIARGSGLEAAAARTALAAGGDGRAEATLRAALEHNEPGAERDWLRFLAASARRLRDVSDGAVESAAVAADYTRLLVSGSAATRSAAFAALCAMPRQDLLDLAVARLADEDSSLRAAARRTLLGLEGEGVLAALEARSLEGSPQVQAELLRVLAVRNPAGIVPQLVMAASKSEQAVLQRTAFELLGASTDDTAELFLRECLAGGVRWSDVVADGLLRHAQRRRASGATAEARALLHEVLQRAGASPACAGALAELRAVAAADSLAVVEPLAARAELRDAVLGVRLAVARSLQKTDAGQARSLAEGVFTGTADRGLRQQAFRVLRELGADVQQLTAASGVVLAWHVLGPFEAATAETLGQHPFGGGPDVAQPFPVRGTPTAWRSVDSDDPDGLIDLRFLKPDHDAVAYALAEVERREAGDAVLEIGSDDGCAVWVNGERVHANFTARGLTPGEDKVKVRLRAGRNRLLVKVSQGGGDWGFCLRVVPAR